MYTKRVLIVDDERLTRIALADFLEDMGFYAVAVGDGPMAIESQQQGPFDICIVDIRMPGMDGVEAILKLHQIAPTSRFIICTGSPQFTVPTSLKAIGIASRHVVFKPIMDMEILVDMITSILSRSQSS